MNGRMLLVLLVTLGVALSGCNGGGKKKVEDTGVVPIEITERDIEKLENLASEHPTIFGFPGQQALAPILDLWFNGTVAAGTASTSAEFPNDDGVVDYRGEIIPFDLSDKVPVGQPVEVRVVLKWWGDPGASADLDIWVDMPGTRDALDPKRFDESMNWGIINKERVVNAVRVEGQPFEVGLQVTNGKVVVQEGMRYAMRVELHFVDSVLAPGVPYAIQVPANSTILVVDTERVVGDEHVDLEMIILDAQDRLVRYLIHNDIGVETLSLTIPGGGEYVVYARSMHGGFVRLEAQVPNPDFMARAITLNAEERILFAGPQPAPGTYAEQGSGGPAQPGTNSYGEQGSFDIGPAFPLDVQIWARSSAGPADVALNITAPTGAWYGTGYSCRTVPWSAVQVGGVLPYCGTYGDENGRIGAPLLQRYDREQMTTGTYTYGVVANGPGMSLGVTVMTYTR